MIAAIVVDAVIWVALIGLIGNIGAQVAGQLTAARGRKKIMDVAEATHIIVNSQRTMMLRLIASLTKRIALENPWDEDAQEQAHRAMVEANTASRTIYD